MCVSGGKATVLLNEKEHFLPLNHAAGSPGCSDRKGPHNFTQPDHPFSQTPPSSSPSIFFFFLPRNPRPCPFHFLDARNRRAREILTSAAIPDVEQKERERERERAGINNFHRHPTCLLARLQIELPVNGAFAGTRRADAKFSGNSPIHRQWRINHGKVLESLFLNSIKIECTRLGKRTVGFWETRLLKV